MDDRRFDNLTKSLARGISRRTVLKGLAGSLLGSTAIAGLTRGAAAFICREPGVLCAEDAQCCSRHCNQATHRCACPSETTLCDRQCCASGQICQDHRCVDPCTPTTCAAQDVACGNIPDGCGHTLSCGACPSATCSTGSCDQGKCSLNPIAGCCTDSSQCDDGNICTADSCDLSTNTCQHVPLTCQPQDICHTANCDSAQGCVQTPVVDGTECGDGMICQQGDCGCTAGTKQCIDGSGPCIPTSSCCADEDCPDNKTCQNGTCACAVGVAICSGICCGSGQTCCGDSTCKQAAGSNCTDNIDCCSGACVNGSCEASCGEDNAPCNDDGDCCGGINCVGATSEVTGACCSSGQTCTGNCCANATDVCVSGACCTPDCTGKTCDDDGCGGSCGSCTTSQTCLGGTCCTKKTCINDYAGQCGTFDDGCGSTIHCDCGFGSRCSDGQCTNPCFSDDDCTAGGPCQRGTCQLHPGGGGSCHYLSNCAPQDPCHTASCATGTCVQTPVSCGACKACNIFNGDCVDNCPPCQICNGVQCVANTSLNHSTDVCPAGQECYDGQCLTCLADNTDCLTSDECCSGECNPNADLGGGYHCQCRAAVIESCTADIQCCSRCCAIVPGLGGTCVDTTEDPNNCGTCARQCHSGDICQNGQCCDFSGNNCY